MPIKGSTQNFEFWQNSSLCTRGSIDLDKKECCHTRIQLGIQSKLNSCKYHLASWTTKWYDYVPVGTHPPATDGLLKVLEQHLLVVGKCSRRFLEGVWMVWIVSVWCLEVVWTESGGCLEAFLIKLEFNLN